MELLSKIASFSSLAGPLSRLASAKVRTFSFPAKSFRKYFLSRKGRPPADCGPYGLVHRRLRLLSTAAFFSRIFLGADCKLRHSALSRQIFCPKSFAFMLQNIFFPGIRNCRPAIAFLTRGVLLASTCRALSCRRRVWGRHESASLFYYTYTRTRARALRVLHPVFSCKLYTGGDKALALN